MIKNIFLNMSDYILTCTTEFIYLHKFHYHVEWEFKFALLKQIMGIVNVVFVLTIPSHLKNSCTYYNNKCSWIVKYPFKQRRIVEYSKSHVFTFNPSYFTVIL